MLTVTNSLFDVCSSGTSGGGISVFRIANVTLANVRVNNAVNMGFGGGCLGMTVDFNNVINSTLTVTNSVFRNCTAKSGQGGGIFLGKISAVALINVSVQNATAALLGECLCAFGIAEHAIWSLAVADSVFADCKENLEGEGVRIRQDTQDT